MLKENGVRKEVAKCSLDSKVMQLIIAWHQFKGTAKILHNVWVTYETHRFLDFVRLELLRIVAIYVSMNKVQTK